MLWVTTQPYDGGFEKISGPILKIWRKTLKKDSKIEMVQHTVSNSLLISHISEQWEFFWMHWRYSKYYWRLLGLFLWLYQPAAITWYSLSSRKHVKMFILLCFWKIKTKEIFDKEIYSMQTKKWLVWAKNDRPFLGLHTVARKQTAKEQGGLDCIYVYKKSIFSLLELHFYNLNHLYAASKKKPLKPIS